MRVLTLILLSLCLIGCSSLSKKSVDDAPAGDELVSVPASFEETLPAELNQILARAESLASNKQYDEADQVLEEAKLKFSSFPHIDLNRALIAIKQNDYTLAESHIDAALVARPDYPPAYNLRGVVYRLSGRFKDAKSAYQQATDAAPNYTNAHLNLGILADLYLHDFVLALAAFEQYLALVPEDTKVKNWVVDLKRRMPDSGEAQ